MGAGRGYNSQDDFEIRTLADAQIAIRALAGAVRMLSGGVEQDGSFKTPLGGLGSDTYLRYNPATNLIEVWKDGVKKRDW